MSSSLAKGEFNRHFLNSAAAQKGGIVYRRRSTIEKYGDLDALIRTCTAKGYTVLAAGDYIVVICSGHEPMFLTQTHLPAPTA